MHPITLNHTHTHTLGGPPLEEGSARRRDLYLTTHNSQKRQISMPPAVFEPAISASERPQSHALERAATGIGLLYIRVLFNHAVSSSAWSLCRLMVTE
jgi:hypothetical protein